MFRFKIRVCPCLGLRSASRSIVFMILPKNTTFQAQMLRKHLLKKSFLFGRNSS